MGSKRGLGVLLEDTGPRFLWVGGRPLYRQALPPQEEQTASPFWVAVSLVPKPRNQIGRSLSQLGAGRSVAQMAFLGLTGHKHVSKWHRPSPVRTGPHF